MHSEPLLSRGRSDHTPRGVASVDVEAAIAESLAAHGAECVGWGGRVGNLVVAPGDLEPDTVPSRLSDATGVPWAVTTPDLVDSVSAALDATEPGPQWHPGGVFSLDLRTTSATLDTSRSRGQLIGDATSAVWRYRDPGRARPIGWRIIGDDLTATVGGSWVVRPARALRRVLLYVPTSADVESLAQIVGRGRAGDPRARKRLSDRVRLLTLRYSVKWTTVAALEPRSFMELEHVVPVRSLVDRIIDGADLPTCSLGLGLLSRHRRRALPDRLDDRRPPGPACPAPYVSDCRHGSGRVASLPTDRPRRPTGPVTAHRASIVAPLDSLTAWPSHHRHARRRNRTPGAGHACCVGSTATWESLVPKRRVGPVMRPLEHMVSPKGNQMSPNGKTRVSASTQTSPMADCLRFREPA